MHCGDGQVGERSQDVGFALEIGQSRALIQGVRKLGDHLFHGAVLDRVGEPQIAHAIDRTHAAQAQHLIDQVPFIEH